MKNKKRNSGLLLAMPAIIGFLIFYLIPFLITVWYSVSFGVGAGEFVGMENYRMIFQNEMFLQAAGNTIRFLGIGIPVILALSFFLALLLQMHLKGPIRWIITFSLKASSTTSILTQRPLA